MAEATIPKKLDKNRPVRLKYARFQKGYTKDTAPEKVKIIFEGKPYEMAFGDECDVLMPFRVAQHYIAKQRTWGDGKNPGNGAMLEIVEYGAVKAASKSGPPVEFDLATCEDYGVLKAKAIELGIELPGNVSKADLKAKLAEALKSKA